MLSKCADLNFPPARLLYAHRAQVPLMPVTVRMPVRPRARGTARHAAVTHRDSLTASYNTLTTSMHHFFRLLGFLALALPSRFWSFAPSLAGSYNRRGLAVLRLKSPKLGKIINVEALKFEALNSKL